MCWSPRLDRLILESSVCSGEPDCTCMQLHMASIDSGCIKRLGLVTSHNNCMYY